MKIVRAEWFMLVFAFALENVVVDFVDMHVFVEVVKKEVCGFVFGEVELCFALRITAVKSQNFIFHIMEVIYTFSDVTHIRCS